jgi:hypothetical protein
LRADAEARTIAGVDFLVVLGLMMVAGLVVMLARDNGPGRARAADWLAAAEACGLANAMTTYDGKERRLQASRGGLRISLAASALFTGAGTTLRLLGLPPWLEIRPRSPGQRRLAGDRGLTVGDDAFDDAFEVRGQRIAAQALLDGPVRRAMAEIFAGSPGPAAELVHVREGRLVAEVDEGEPATRLARLTALLRSVQVIVDRVDRPEAAEARLAESVRSDPHAPFRLRCLELLLQERPEHPATAAAVRAARADADRNIRLAAALAAPVEGRAVLLQLARDDASSDAVASGALASVGHAIDGVELERILSVALGAEKEATVVACLEVLARAGEHHVPAILRVLESEVATRAAAAARALGATGALRAAPALVQALTHAEAAVREASAVSLGRVGATADDVLALRQAEAAHAWDGTFLRAVREAIASIQSRLVGAEQGQLSVAPDSGELSLAEEPDGRVSIARDGEDA